MGANTTRLCLGVVVLVTGIFSESLNRKAVFVDLADKTSPFAGESDCEQRLVHAHVLHDGSVRLNWQDIVKSAGLERRLAEILKTRVERIVFIGADPDVPFGTFLRVVSIAKRQAEFVAIMTPAIAREKGCWTFVRWEHARGRAGK